MQSLNYNGNGTLRKLPRTCSGFALWFYGWSKTTLHDIDFFFIFQALDNFAFQVLNGAGDLIDLMHAVDKEGRPNFDKMSKDELKLYVRKNSHCSALIKVGYVIK